MTKYIIRWDSVHGDMYDVVEADNKEEAYALAYKAWYESSQDNADYGVEEYTDELVTEFLRNPGDKK